MERKKSTFRNDLLLIFAILIVAGGLLLVWLLTRSTGSYAVITVDGKETARYSLHTDTEIQIETEYGYNLLIIQNGTASVREADCDSQLCVHKGSVCYNGETIVCLPHRLVIRIENGNDGADAVAR